MVRETRHLWVGNLPDNIREDRIREHFKRYGRVQNVKLLGRPESASAGVAAAGASGICATVAFMDIKSASKAHNTEHILEERTLTTEYYEPAAIPSTAGAPSAGSSPAGSGYSGSSSSVNSVPAPSSAPRYHLSGGEDSSGTTTCPIAASAAAPANWRGTNDSATEYCRRGNTPATYGRYQRNNSTAPLSTPPSNVERTTPHRWYASSERAGATGGESTPSTPGGGTESGPRRRNSGSASSRSDSTSPEPSDTSRASTPPTQPPLSHHNNHRTPTSINHQWASTASGRPLAICVRNLPTRSTDSSLKDGLYHEYKKHGKVVWVKVVGQNADRYAVVRFKKPSDVEKALEVSQDKLFFGCKISVAPHQSGDDDAESAKPYETDIDEYHPKATRTLFIGNLEKDVTQQQLRDKFKHFGRIIEIDIKKGSCGGAGYAFCQYASISSVVEAIRAVDGEHVGGSRVKLGFGKPVATACVWVDGLTEHTEKQVLGAVSRCGAATSVCVDRAAGAALVHFEQAAAAGAAVRELRRVAAAASAAEPDLPRLCVDYASRECQDAFYEQLEKHGGSAALAGSERLSSELTGRYVPSARHDSLRFEGSRSRASSFGRSCSRTPRYSAVEHYDPVDYAADRRYRVYDEPGTTPPPDDAVPFEDRLQSVVVSPHRARRHRRDSSPDDRKHSKERLRSIGGSVRRSRSGSGGRERHARRRHRRKRDGSGSRAGTPLRDEPDAPPAEPRRPPRDRPPLPMCLPLPKFAAQIVRAAPPVPARPAPPPAPDSPPRPPSASSSSGGSAPHSPSLEERIRSLDEKYEKWSGSRAIVEAGDRARLRHRLLEVDINEVKPSEVVRSLLAKRSVFDEDSERLEVATRAPSPPRAPRSRSSPARHLRYPFPAHPAASTPAHDTYHEVDVSDRLPDPRLNRPDKTSRKEKIGTLVDDDYVESRESRGRPRTPSTDRSQHESYGRRSPSTLPDAGDVESQSRDSVPGNCDVESKSSCDTDEKDFAENQRERANSSASDSLLTVKSDCLENIPMPLPRNESDRKCGEIKLEISDSSHNSHSDELCARDVMDMILKKIENGHKYETALESTRKLIKYDFRKDETHSNIPIKIENKFEPFKKLDCDSNQMFDMSLEIKESLEHELQNHINASSAVKTDGEKSDLNYSDAITLNEKDRSTSSPQMFRNTQFEKENIKVENPFEKENSCISNISTVEVLTSASKTHRQEVEKHIDDRIKNERDRAKHNKAKDKHECDKEKLKISRIEKNFEKSEKDKKNKDDNSIEKHCNDKVESMKTLDKNIKEKSDRESEKPRHSDDKPRHVYHRRDSKSDKDKRRDSEDTAHSKTKKEDKHKSKKDNELKRDPKKETETVKSRKSSHDESTKEISRKDSTDSTTSRTSHELKVKDLETHDLKEEMRPKVRLTDLFVKLEKNKDFHHTKDGFIKVKQENDKITNNCATDSHSTTTEQGNNKSKADVIDKQRHHSVDSPSVDSKRKERLNSCSSLPSNIGHKRRVSSQDNFDLLLDDPKKIKSEPKIPERRDSKESKGGDRHKTTKFSKGHFAKIIESKTKDDKKNQVKPPDDSFEETGEVKNENVSVIRPIKKSPKDDGYENNRNEHKDEIHNNLDFLALLELRSSEEDEKQKALRKEMKEKKRIQQLQQIQELQMQQEVEFGKMKEDKKQKSEEKKRDCAREKRMSTERKSREDKGDSSKRKNRKPLQSSDTSDSDEPKKHSIFDIVDDGPTYISMYDKVKARSCKNMQKQEEEKRQEKIKAKFSQLKQSRAKREEKKRSSWDEDSDSDQEGERKHQKSSLDSSDDDSVTNQNRNRDKFDSSNIEFDENKTEDYFSMPNDEDYRNKLSRKNSRTRIMSDTSDDEASKNKCLNFMRDPKKLNTSDPESRLSKADSSNEYCSDKISKNSLLNLFGKSDSDDSKLKSSLENDNNYKPMNIKSFCNDISSECESVSSCRNLDMRRKHKKKQKKHKPTYSDDDNKIETSDTGACDSEMKHKKITKQRRHSSKKDKRKDKTRDSNDTDDGRDDKIKTIKREKNSPDIHYDYGNDSLTNITKRDGKMEDIFGPLSDESDKDNKHHIFKSDLSPHDYESNFCMNEVPMNSIEKDMKRKKEKRRKEKRWLSRDDDNSLDVDAVSKAIEANLLTITDDTENIRSGSEFKYIDGSLVKDGKATCKYDKFKRENKEKRKKKKRSREERLGRKDFHHLYQPDSLDKNDTQETSPIDTVSNAMLLDIPLPNENTPDDKMEDCKSLSHSPSLPRLTDSPPILVESSQDADVKSTISSICNTNLSGDENSQFVVDGKDIEIEQIPMPPPLLNIVQDISEVPLPAEPAPEPVTEIKPDVTKSILTSDSDTSDDAAVTNIPVKENESDNIVEKQLEKVDIPTSKSDKKPEEKPRAVISQEETEDAVAALLGESFGGKINTFSSYEEAETSSTHQTDIENTTLSNENIPEEDAEEMRQAVQNLNACEMEMKPDTPVSDSDLLLIDTDTEEADETPSDTVEKLPANPIAMNRPVHNNSEQTKCIEETTTEVPSQKIKTDKPLVPSEPAKITQSEANIKSNESDVKIKLAKRENVQIKTSAATPVITSWTLSNNKMREPHHVINIQSTMASKHQSESTSNHITANIVQMKTPQPQNVLPNNLVRPVMPPARPSAPYQVINQIVRPPSSNMQPPTIKIPEPHIMYQKPQGIVISPRISNDPRMQSPKTSPQAEGITSPRLANMTILTSTPQNLNTGGMMSPTSKLQRSPGQVTVVRVQQPPLSPIQTLHGVHAARTMMSPNRPNSVLVQGTPLHFNRLPVTPVLTPIPKQINVNTLHQNKNVVTTTPLAPQHKNYIGENRKNEHGSTLGNKNENAKIILSPTSLQHSNNPTLMAQNRLISMQNAVHLGNINSAIHLGNKVVINKMNQMPEKRETQLIKSSDHVTHSPFGSSQIIHVAGSHNSSVSLPSIIQSGNKSIMCNIQEPNIINRGQSSNIVHTQRLMTTTVSKSNVIQIDKNKNIPTVLSMANIRSPTVLTKLETSSLPPPVSHASHTNVTPILLKPIGNLRMNTKAEQDIKEPKSCIVNESPKRSEEKTEAVQDKKSPSEQNAFLLKSPIPKSNTQEVFTKCETDFEELLKDNTNEIKVTNNPEKKLEVNVGKTTTLITPNSLPDKPIIQVTESNPIKKDQDLSGPDRATLDESSVSQKEEKISIELIKSTVHNNIVSCSKPVLSPDNSKDTAVESSEIRQDKVDQKLNLVNKSSRQTEPEIHEKEDLKPFDFMTINTLADPLTKTSNQSDDIDDQLKNLDDNDSWSVKDLNIESVIKKVDSLCDSIDTLQPEVEKTKIEIMPEKVTANVTDATSSKQSVEPVLATVITDYNVEKMEEASNVEKTANTSKRGGRNIRGKRGQKGQDKVQTRQISKPARGTTAKRGRGRAKTDKKIKNLVINSGSTLPGDVYDFHEDSGDETSNKTEARPRLILTIKSPLSGQAGVTATSTLSITQKDQNKVMEKLTKEEKTEDFVSPSTNTRKSRRLQEKDVHRSVADEIGEDGSPAQGRAPKRRPTRQAGGKVTNTNDKSTARPQEAKKSPRGNKRTRDRSLSDASTESGDGEATRDPKVPKLDERIAQSETEPPTLPFRSTPPGVPSTTVTSPAARPPVPHLGPATAPPVISSAAHATVSVAPPVVPPVAPLIVPPGISAAIAAPASVPPAIPTPITKPPKKMISEMSAKLASAFEAAAQHRAEPEPAREPSPAAPATGDAHAGDARRPMDSMPGATMPVGATEAADARVHSPALPHRLPLPGRATPILVRGGDGEGAGNAIAGGAVGAVGAAAGLASARHRALGAGGCGAASLPRGAHHPPPDPLAHVKPLHAMHHAPIHHHHPGAASRITSVPAISPQGQMPMGDGMYPHFSHQHYQMYQHHFRATQHESRATQSPFNRTLEAEGSEAPTPPELRRPPTARVPRPAHSPSTADRLIMYAVGCGRSPPPAHTSGVPRVTSALPPSAAPGPPHASQVPREADSLQMLLRRYPVMWQGLLALKNDSAAVQMHFVGGNPGVAGDTLARADQGTPMLRIAQRMRLEPAQLDQVHRKMKLENEHCILLALPCGRDHMDVLLQSTNLTNGFITYLQRKQAAGIVNIAPPGHHQAMFTVHIFPSCDFANENLTRIAPDLMHRVADIAHLLIVIATV